MPAPPRVTQWNTFSGICIAGGPSRAADPYSDPYDDPCRLCAGACSRAHHGCKAPHAPPSRRIRPRERLFHEGEFTLLARCDVRAGRMCERRRSPDGGEIPELGPVRRRRHFPLVVLASTDATWRRRTAAALTTRLVPVVQWAGSVAYTIVAGASNENVRQIVRGIDARGDLPAWTAVVRLSPDARGARITTSTTLRHAGDGDSVCGCAEFLASAIEGSVHGRQDGFGVDRALFGRLVSEIASATGNSCGCGDADRLPADVRARMRFDFRANALATARILREADDLTAVVKLPPDVWALRHDRALAATLADAADRARAERSPAEDRPIVHTWRSVRDLIASYGWFTGTAGCVP
jgi:hypothetical protein